MYGLTSFFPLAGGCILLLIWGGWRLRGRSRGFPLPLDTWQESAQTAARRAGLDASLPLRLVHGFSVALGIVAWLLMAVSLSGPYRRESLPGGANHTATVMVALDVSPSMAAMDLVPNRMETALRAVGSFLDSGPEASVGLLAFGADAALLCPPTERHEIVRERLKMAKPGLLGNGTAIGVALAQALALLSASPEGERMLILISDGEDTVGRIYPEDVAAHCLRSGVRLLVLGLGTRGQVDMAYVDPYSGEQRSGMYESDFNEQSLMSLARIAGGRYLGPTQVHRLIESGSESLSGISEHSAWPGFDSGKAAVAADSAQGTRRVSLAMPFWFAACGALALGWLGRMLVLGGVA